MLVVVPASVVFASPTAGVIVAELLFADTMSAVCPTKAPGIALMMFCVESNVAAVAVEPVHRIHAPAMPPGNVAELSVTEAAVAID